MVIPYVAHHSVSRTSTYPITGLAWDSVTLTIFLSFDFCQELKGQIIQTAHSGGLNFKLCV